MRTRPKQSGLYDPEYEHDACGVGFVAHIKGRRSHEIVDQARDVLVNMEHRGAVGSDPETGDGSGILTALPHRFLSKVARDDLGVSLPDPGHFAAGLVFLPRDPTHCRAVIETTERIALHVGLRPVGWREVPRESRVIGMTARASEPEIRLFFVAIDESVAPDEFERRLFLARKTATRAIRGGSDDPDHAFYVCSLSTRVIVYKGMLKPDQLFRYYPDLTDPIFESHLAMIHSRFSTNTFPSWDRAQPLRFMSHNGEINTLRGNINKMHARQGTLRSALFGDRLSDAFPIIEPDLSDSGNFDNVFELLLMTGRELPEAVMMMVPEPWQHHRHMPDAGSAMYEYYSAMMEPWDGPASIAFTDGHVIGALLDRNGLRPSRYYVTEDDIVVMASEVGVLDIPASRVRTKGRLKPGRMFLVDFELGRIVGDEELKNRYAYAEPFRAWLNGMRVRLEDIPPASPPEALDDDELLRRLKLFGYTREHLQEILTPMARDAKEPLGSMGNDAPLAALSSRPRLLYDYFKQLFAQVTNPPIDSIREDLIMSLSSYIGPERNLLEPTPEHAHRLQLDVPFLTDREMAAIRAMDHRGMRTYTIDATYRNGTSNEALAGAVLRETLTRLEREADQAIADGYAFLCLSDRAAGRDRVPVSALVAVGIVHHHLVRNEKRTQIGILVESGEPREVHHFCLLVGYGADAVNPYLVTDAFRHLRRTGDLPGDFDEDRYIENYFAALSKGMLKVFGKMGISTLESYRAAQIFEAVGPAREVVDRAFVGTANRIPGVGWDQLAHEAHLRWEAAYGFENEPIGDVYLNPGDYSVRSGGEPHMWDPESIADLRVAAQMNDPEAYARFRDRRDRHDGNQATIRGLLNFAQRDSVPIDEVEPVSTILRRFASGAMSFGSISREAHETLAIAMNRIGGKSNTGEGGEMRERYTPLANGDSKRSAIKQVASGRFGVTGEYLANAVELQIKMAQGAKPGEGGELPGHKVFDVIARTRHSTTGVGLISPPPHHDIYSIEDLAQLIFDLKNANPEARISVKLVSEVGVGTVAAGVAKAHADHILISGHDGGTGASPLTGIKNAGLPWELGLAETHQTLVLNDLRSRVVVQTDGQIKTGRDVVTAALLGADEIGIATAALISMGCIMMRKCQKNTCPVGIATQDPRLRARFTGRAEHVINYLTFVAADAREWMARLGFRTFDEMIGRSDLLEIDTEARNWKSRHVDISAVVRPGGYDPATVDIRKRRRQNHGIDDVLDRSLIRDAAKALDGGRPVALNRTVRNTDRAVGTMLSWEISRRYGEAGLPDGTIQIALHGSAGQSLGAWLAPGVEIRLAGDANDYVGKGLSGGRLVITPPADAGFAAEENIIVGNVALYGATSGEAFIRGQAAERFAVRNSGATVVVEGLGDHGCEYMTGGRAVILGKTGRNFGAGMSGGVAYVYWPGDDFRTYVNSGLVEVLPLDDPQEIAELRGLVRRHFELTDSRLARALLADWSTAVMGFHRVISPAYRRFLACGPDESLLSELPDTSVSEHTSHPPTGPAEAQRTTGDSAGSIEWSANRREVVYG